VGAITALVRWAPDPRFDMHLVLEGLFQDEGGDYRPIRVGPPQPFVFEIPALIIEGISVVSQRFHERRL
jgi:hypothetical protein